MDSRTLRCPIDDLNPKKPICVTTDSSLRSVIDKMKENEIGCVCITRDSALVGILTERDVLTRVVGSGLDVDQTGVDKVMTTNPEYLYVDDQMAYALNRMHVGGFRHVPLIDLKGRPVGVISVRDIAAYLVKSLKNAA